MQSDQYNMPRVTWVNTYRRVTNGNLGVSGVSLLGYFLTNPETEPLQYGIGESNCELWVIKNDEFKRIWEEPPLSKQRYFLKQSNNKFKRKATAAMKSHE